MTDRKFTAPTEFPAEYVDGCGDRAVILGRGPNKEFPFIGYDAEESAVSWTELGEYRTDDPSEYDLHDIPKRIITWHNVYYDWIGPQCSSRGDADEVADQLAHAERLCVYRIERDPDGGNPEIFVEKVEDFKEKQNA